MNLSSVFLHLKKKIGGNLEIIFWISGMVLIFFMNTESNQATLCVFRFIGFNHCPGCGIGHSIHHALHFQFWQSYQSHWMGLPSVVIIFFRIHQLGILKYGKISNKNPLPHNQ